MTPHDRSEKWKKIYKQLGADPNATKQLDEALDQSIEAYLAPIRDGIIRVHRLVALATDRLMLERSLNEENKEPESIEMMVRAAEQEILRAAVVQTHAHLEEFLGNISALLLSNVDQNELAGYHIPLGRLVRCKDRPVCEIIPELVAEQFQHHTFNGASEIRSLITALKLDCQNHRSDLAAIDQMIRRRHDIVHRADRLKVPASDTRMLQAIDEEQLLGWLTSTISFTVRLGRQAAKKITTPDEVAKSAGILLPVSD